MTFLSTLALLVLSSPARGGVLPPAERLGGHAEAMKRAVERPTVRRTIGPIETPLPMEISDYLLDHPDMAAWLVRRHKIAPYVVEMRGPDRSWADDGDGTTGFIDQVVREPGKRAYYTEGTHVSAIFPDIRAAAVVLLTLEPVRRPGCAEHVLGTFDVHLRMRSRFVAGVVKALKPFIAGLLMKKFTRAFGSAREVAVLLARDPEGTRRELLSFPGLSEADRAEGERVLSAVQAEPASCLAPAPAP